MTDQTSEIKIYVACLAAYNNGHLHGRWINADQDASAIWDEVRAMLKDSPIEGAEEWSIHDHEGFEGLSISEWCSFERVSEIAQFIREEGTAGAQMIAHFGDIETAKDAFEHNFIAEYDTVEDCVRDMTEQSTEIPENLQYYIDWEAMARDWEINDILALNSGRSSVLVFWQS